ncbi:MAG: hypothetical protein ACREDZ_00770 [Kiloniellales bacterium]
MISTAESYELQVRHHGNWRGIKTFTDREHATRRAKELLDEPGCEGVRVVAECFDEERQLYVPRTVFRNSKVAESKLKDDRIDRALARLLDDHRSVITEREHKRESRRQTLRRAMKSVSRIAQLILGTAIGVLAALSLHRVLDGSTF